MEAIQDLRKFLLNCNIAGFTYGEGCIVMEELKVGTELTLDRDKYNKFDPLAIAVYYKNSKLGYIPQKRMKLFVFSLIWAMMIFLKLASVA